MFFCAINSGIYISDYLRARQSYCKDGSGNGQHQIKGAVALADGSVVIAGFMDGDWSGINKGWRDFAAVKLHIDGVEKWRYQVRQMLGSA